MNERDEITIMIGFGNFEPRKGLSGSKSENVQNWRI